MEDFKIDLFEEENEISFPKYITLKEVECIEIADKISNKYKFQSLLLENELSKIQIYYDLQDVNVNFQLIEFLNKVSIKSNSKIYLNWYKFKEIDLMSLIDVNNYFYDIWYPISDDLDLFDESLDWMISIRHDGSIYYFNKQKS